MRSREYDKRVEIYTGTKAQDGFGGHTVNYALSVSSWAKIVSGVNMSQTLTELGITDISNTIVVKLRHRLDFDYTANAELIYLKYRNEDYIIKSIVNKDFKDVDIEIIATKKP